MGRRLPARRPGPLHATALAACAAAALHFAGGADRAPTLALGKRRLRFGGYEFHGFKLRKAPKFPVAFGGTSVALEGASEDLRGFPHSTTNTAGLKLGLRPVEGQLSIRLKDPGQEVENLDQEGQLIEVAYGQHVPGIGEVKGRATSSGEWDAALTKNIPELGRLSAAFDSQMDWSIELAKNYAPFGRFVPSANYGATQDGMRFQANVSGGFDQNSRLNYAVSNPAGKYGPEDWIHEGDITLDSHSGHHEVALHGIYSRQLPKVPMRGSLTYTARGKLGTLTALINSDKYRLQATLGRHLGFATTLGREEEEAGRAVELEVRTAFLTATAKAIGDKARVRVGLDI